ncbi:MAG TPA: hypothetical protein PKD29_02845 [Rhodocyclaceae bacterium]|nr:hypothetical protein [Rhodocyclaceae bacterium]
MPAGSIIPAIISTIVNSVTNAPPPVQPPVAGLVRNLPAEAVMGEMQPPQWGQVQIDGKTLALAPGLQIRNEQNLIVVPTAVQQPATVRYVTDPYGKVFRVWILSSAELAAAR